MEIPSAAKGLSVRDYPARGMYFYLSGGLDLDRVPNLGSLGRLWLHAILVFQSMRQRQEASYRSRRARCVSVSRNTFQVLNPRCKLTCALAKWRWLSSVMTRLKPSHNASMFLQIPRSKEEKWINLWWVIKEYEYLIHLHSTLWFFLSCCFSFR